MFILLVRHNFKDYFAKKDEIKSTVAEEMDRHEGGFHLNNLKLYSRGVTLTLFYLLMAPVFTSIISLVLAFVSPILIYCLFC